MLFFVVCWVLFKINFFQKSFLGSLWKWEMVRIQIRNDIQSKLFVKVFSRWQKLPLATSADFFQNYFFQKIFKKIIGVEIAFNPGQEWHSIKSRSKLFLKVFSGWQKLQLATSADFFPNYLFQKNLSWTLSGCESVWIQIRTDILSIPDLGPSCLQKLSADEKSCC